MMDNGDIKVSVIVPIYNTELYLEECLQHLATQTLKEIEVIMINDGSEDRSEEIARVFAENYPNFSLVNQENRGPSASRNRGIQLARGKYIQFCDSDDFLVENALEILFEKAEEEKLEILHFETMEFYNSDVSHAKRERNAGLGAQYYNHIFSGKACLNVMLQTDVKPSPCIMLIKRSVLQYSNVRFCDGILQEDNLFQYQLYLQVRRMKNITDGLYYRRLRKQSIMSSDYMQRKRFFGFAKCFIEMSADYDIKYQTTFPYIINYPKHIFQQTMKQMELTIANGDWGEQEKQVYAQIQEALKEFKGKKTYKMCVVAYAPKIYQLYCLLIKKKSKIWIQQEMERIQKRGN